MAELGSSKINGDLIITSGDLKTSSNVATLFNTGALTVNAFNSSTNIGIGNAVTSNQSINVGIGATISGAIKNIYLGANGVSGSTTNIHIGTDVSGSISNIYLKGIIYSTTATTGTNTTQVATTAYANAIAGGTTIPAKSLASNGYVKMANGLILQWATITTISGSNTWTFPLAFLSGCYNVMGNPNVSGNTTSYAFNVASKSTTNTVINTTFAGSMICFALGS